MSKKIELTKEEPTKGEAVAEEQPNKMYSFIVGIVIGIAIIALFVFLFPR